MTGPRGTTTQTNIFNNFCKWLHSIPFNDERRGCMGERGPTKKWTRRPSLKIAARGRKSGLERPFVAANKEHEHATGYKLVMAGNFVDFLTPVMHACQSFKYGEPN